MGAALGRAHTHQGAKRHRPPFTSPTDCIRIHIRVHYLPASLDESNTLPYVALPSSRKLDPPQSVRRLAFALPDCLAAPPTGTLPPPPTVLARDNFKAISPSSSHSL